MIGFMKNDYNNAGLSPRDLVFKSSSLGSNPFYWSYLSSIGYTYSDLLNDNFRLIEYYYINFSKTDFMNINYIIKT